MAGLVSDSSRLRALTALGQSPWFDFIARHMLRSGAIDAMVAAGEITGITSNPTIFEKAVAASHDYDGTIWLAAARGVTDPYEAFVAMATEDIRAACDALRSVYDATAARDGYVSLEVPPGIEHDVERTVAEARRLFALVARPNLMIKVPGTPAGIRALEELTAAGVNVNQTLLFAVEAYEQVARAYIAGLKRRRRTGEDVSRVASVASFFVSRVDTAVDALLPGDSPLRGRIAVANARRAYARFQAIVAGPEWEALAAAGAMVQRPLWASTGTKNPAYSDVLYVEELIAPDTVNTMPEATLRAASDHLDVQATLVPGIARSEADLAALAAAGVDLRAVTDQLLVDGLAAFEKDFLRLLDRLREALTAASVTGGGLGALAGPVGDRLQQLDADHVVERTWAHDHTIWKPDPAEIVNRLGWLDIAERMLPQTAGLAAFAREVAAEGFTTAVLLGMGGSSLAPEVLQATFGTAPGMLRLEVLDSTDPAQIAALEASLDLPSTLFVVSSKSGGTIETRSQFAYFLERTKNPRQFVAITDPGSSLEADARSLGLRQVFINDPDIGGRYSALSHFGLVPAALVGVDLPRLLRRAIDMANDCRDVRSFANPGAWLGAVMGEAALRGRDKLTLVLPPELATLGYWIEQLVAESAGKEGKGILPVEGEDLGSPEVYGDDRLFVAIGDDPRLAALEAAGHPVVRLPYVDRYQLGAEFFRWELATAVAGHVLGIQPFDQPNVQEAKDATSRILATGAAHPAATPLEGVLAGIRPGDYAAILAYLPRNEETAASLQECRMAIRDRWCVATTVGFGPRYLHSTGQLHKGGANTGVFIQVVDGSSERDLAIPGQPYTFRELRDAQALGDLASLQAHGRRVARVTLDALRREVL